MNLSDVVPEFAIGKRPRPKILRMTGLDKYNEHPDKRIADYLGALRWLKQEGMIHLVDQCRCNEYLHKVLLRK